MAVERNFGFIVFLSLAMVFDIHAFRISNYFKDLQASPANSETYLTPLQILRKHGYPAEAHIVESADGYFLELHRVPYGKSGPGDKKRPPVFLHHGLLCSSIDWVINGPEKSLAYRLADEGYDVWMANGRGNTFSRGHAKLSPSQREFWDFSFHEMGIYDLPAAIDHILATTEEEQLIYIGHSMGTTVFYVMASTLPEYNKKIKFQISMAPVTAIPHTTSAFRFLVPYAKMIHDMSDWYNKGAFLEHDLMTKMFCKFFCARTFWNINICEQYIIFSLFGKDVEQFNTTLIPVITSNIPAGTSGKNMIHASQLISSRSFTYYDYGKAENIKKYGAAIPPKYNISSITVPIKVYYGENDILSDPLDTKLMYQKISNPMGLQKVGNEKFNHVDFIWAKDVNKLFNDELIAFIKNASDYYYGFDFVQENVQQAITTRSTTPAPVDEPFNEAAFFMNYQKEYGVLSTLPLPSGNFTDITKYPKLAQDQALNSIKTIKNEIDNAYITANKAVEGAVSQGIQQFQASGEKFRNGIEDTGNRVSKTIKDQLDGAKQRIEKTKNDLEHQIKESLEKLGKIFT